MQADPGSSLTEKIADRLADEIIRGDRAPGSRIQELTLAKQLGVSRGSVREALLILEKRHLIEILPRRGAVVTDFPPDEMREFSEVYSLLQKRLFKLCRHRGSAVRDAFDGAINAMSEARSNADATVLNEAQAQFVYRALDLAGDRYLDWVLRPLVAVDRRLQFRADANPAQNADAVLAHYRALRDAMQMGTDEQIEQLVAEYNRRSLMLAQR